MMKFRRPGRRAGRTARAKHTHNFLGGVLYTAKRHSMTYNEIIPESEKVRTSPFARLKNRIASGISKQFTCSERPVKNPKGRHAQKTKEVCYPLFADRAVVWVTLICIGVAAASFIGIPVAFAKNEISVNVLDAGRNFTALTTAETVGEFIEKNEIEIGEQDYLETPAETPIEENMDIIIRRAMALTVKTDANAHEISMIAGSVEDALELAGVPVDEDDEVYPALDTYIRPGMTIDYIKVDVETVTESRVIGYKEQTREDSSLLKGKTQVVQHGEEGEVEIQTRQVYKNGILYSEDVVAETVVKEAVNKIVAVGTKSPPKAKPASAESSSSSGSVSAPAGGPSADRIREVRTMEATAYHEDGSRRTASGTYPKVGTIAADPRVLPYGTELYIVGYGYGRVEDTGGFVKRSSNIIDLFMSSDSQCRSWGRRNVTVYILN